ncbi:hypothetical protein [Formosa maritima]|uniref:Uncharacterized protein n=1 Tax=Formosa maritima TaxID=2592046 RepID=A0A5D0G8M4_9FLAO|nr:hypothetical protein [Formosa maritima]TYA55288.1 hypothetical protein FVF61_07540 [Formosa maritima]
MWKYVLAWIPMVFIAIANGLFRESFLTNKFTDLQAHQLSTGSALLLFGIYIWFLMLLVTPVNARQAFLIGLLWLGLTIAFEFVFGHYVAGHSWSKLFHDYNLLEGRIWLLVLIWISLAPYIFYKLQN